MSEPVSYYYFVDDRTRTVYYTETFSMNPDHIYVGTSDNPNPRMAVAAFLQNGMVTQGFTLKKL